MKLSEGKLFTIEALNRIEGFVWPERANYAFMNHSEMFVTLTSIVPHIVAGEEHGFYDGDKADYIGTGRSHPDWKNSLITRTELESVDGWVRNDGSIPSISGDFDLMLDDGHIFKSEYVTLDWDWSLSCEAGETITHWRYHKPQNPVSQEDDSAPVHSIETLIGRHKAARTATLEARRQLDAAETAERELMRDIEAWAESQGFDIRVLSESEEKPELVITDWRDLQKGDVIWWSGDSSCDAGECNVVEIAGNDYIESMVILVDHPGGVREWVDTKKEEWRFIRRPTK